MFKKEGFILGNGIFPLGLHDFNRCISNQFILVKVGLNLFYNNSVLFCQNDCQTIIIVF